jgi:hypothetical protein
VGRWDKERHGIATASRPRPTTPTSGWDRWDGGTARIHAAHHPTCPTRSGAARSSWRFTARSALPARSRQARNTAPVGSRRASDTTPRLRSACRRMKTCAALSSARRRWSLPIGVGAGCRAPLGGGSSGTATSFGRLGGTRALSALPRTRWMFVRVPPSLYEHEKSALVGGAGGEYGAAHGLWLPHFHLIAHAALVPTLNRLADRFHPKSDRTYHPVLAQRVRGPAEQASYCAKAYCGFTPHFSPEPMARGA